MKLLLIRHGATAGNALRRYIGRTDEPLSAAGAEALRRLPKLTAAWLGCSPALRCRQTAALLFPGLEPVICGDLRECDFGWFENRSADEMADFPPYRQWVEGGCQGAIPGGEDPADFRRRCAGALADLLPRLPAGETSALVLHGGSIRALLAAYGDQQGFFDLKIPCGCCLVCDVSPEDGYIRLREVDRHVPD